MSKGEFKKTIGTRAEVYHGTARRTSGGLTKGELMMNKHGRIVSKKKHNTANTSITASTRACGLIKDNIAVRRIIFNKLLSLSLTSLILSLYNSLCYNQITAQTTRRLIN